MTENTNTVTQDKIQKLELETVKAVTEMRGDIKALTATIKDLRDTIDSQNKNFVTKSEYEKEIANIYLQVAEAKRIGRIRAFLWSVAAVGITTLVVYEITKALS